MSEPMYITRHAFDRAKERLGWKPAALERMLPKVLEDGVYHAQTKGHLKKWLSGKFFMHKATDARIYGQHAFFFKGNNLVTILHLPPELKKFL